MLVNWPGNTVLIMIEHRDTKWVRVGSKWVIVFCHSNSNVVSAVRSTAGEIGKKSKMS